MSIHDLTSNRGPEDEHHLKLLQRVAVKDKVAFERLYAHFYPQLTRYLSRMMRRPEMVEEVVADTLFVVWEKAYQFQGRSKVSTWITGIAYLKGIKALDKLKTMPEQQADDINDHEAEVEGQDTIGKVGMNQWLSTALDRISPDQRSVVELTYFSGHSYQEIAEIMQCPVNTVKTRMFHARRRLAKLLPVLEDGLLSAEVAQLVNQEVDRPAKEGFGEVSGVSITPDGKAVDDSLDNSSKTLGDKK